MVAFYNENNPESAAMIRQFMADGLIPHGTVDERSITEIDPDELKRYTQCHFFAGIAGWTFALQLARWPTERPVWTGSCPCQPFSSAGRQKGKDDDRHLWPVWERLIRECRPSTIFGEQVESAIAHGWLDDVYKGLEPEGYAIGAAVLPACGVGSPHKRNRLWFVAHAQSERPSGGPGEVICEIERPEGHNRDQPGKPSDVMADTEMSECQFTGEARTGWYGLARPCVDVADTEGKRWKPRRTEPERQQGQPGFTGASLSNSLWNIGQWINCPDGKQRLIEPSISLLAHGVQHRRPIIHALGNAIVPQVAAEFIIAGGDYVER